MNVSYRIVEEINPNGEWESVGVIVHWPEDASHMQLRGMLQHTVSRSIWAKIRQRVKKQHLTLETYDTALADYDRFYRLLPEVYQLTADTAAEIRRQLREKYIFASQAYTVQRSEPGTMN